PQADAVFVLEAARENGAVVTARKGITDVRIEFTGRAAHSGVEPQKGRSAVLEAAHATIAIHALNGRWDGTTFNVGVSHGGTRVNVVPERAALTVEIRSTTEAALTAAEGELRSLAGRNVVPDVTTTLEMSREHDPMERSDGTAALFERARSIAAQLGLTLEEAATGGAAGEKGAARAAYFGKRVAVIERRKQPGGATVHTGTLPSKTLREAALFLSGYRQRDLYGVSVEVAPHLEIARLIARKNAVRELETDRMLENLASHGVELVHGSARLI